MALETRGASSCTGGGNRWTDGLLDEQRTVGDPLCLGVLEELVAEQGAGGTAALFRADLLGAVCALEGRGSSAARKFLCDVGYHRAQNVGDGCADCRPWPSVEAVRSMDRGRSFFLRHTGSAGLVLFHGSLVASFTAAKGNKVLVGTGRLGRGGDPRRRLAETLAFVHGLMTADMHTEVPLMCARVRLLHGAVAMSLRDGWDTARLGVPINQEDLAGTVNTFSCVVLMGLERLWVLPSREEREGYHRLWQHAAALMGMDEAMCTATPQDEEDQCAAIRRRQCVPDADSAELTDALFEACAGRFPIVLSRRRCAELSRLLIGDDELCDGIRLPAVSLMTRALVAALGLYLWLRLAVQRLAPCCHKRAERQGRGALSFVVARMMRGQRRPLYRLKKIKVR